MKFLSLSLSLSLCLSLSLSAQPIVHFTLEVASVGKGEKVYNVIAEDFDDVLTVQYSLSFDNSKMQFKEVRSPLIEGVSDGNFGINFQGYLLSSWFDPDLILEDLPNPVVIYQLVFETLEPGGSTLCFSTDPLDHEVSLEGEVIALLLIDDDCHTGLLLDPEATAVIEQKIENTFLKDIHLSAEGEMSFTMTESKEIEFSLIDMTGKLVTRLPLTQYAAGRNNTGTNTNLIPGIYSLLTSTASGNFTVKVYVR